ILMSDQDDRWVPGRVAMFLEALRTSHAVVASSNTSFMDSAGNAIDFAAPPLLERNSARHASNILAIFSGDIGYYGCAMAFRRQVIDVVLPMPSFTESHDLWIALAGNLMGANVHIERSTLLRRIHGSNASVVQRGLWPKLRSRVIFALSMA